eukprot:GEMP01111129.1.p1 GENE.GEMP01111129.1~~GEMP01111129.1.p1  ORF type:complete len:154 (+),score=20.96 GEMP01111129.1:64-462(+)
MGKGTALSKAELKEVLKKAKNPKERNRAVKLLKQYDPNPNNEHDAVATKANMVCKKYDYLVAYICWRCDKVKHCNLKVHWNTPDGKKLICHSCYNQLVEREEIDKMRTHNQRAGLIPKGFGFGLTGANEKLY